MRSLVAALLVALMGWAIAIDPLACPDGCADAGDAVVRVTPGPAAAGADADATRGDRNGTRQHPRVSARVSVQRSTDTHDDACGVQSPAGACPFCVGVTAARHEASLVPGARMSDIRHTTVDRLPHPPTHGIDHPPRLA